MNIQWKSCIRIVLTVLAAYLCIYYWEGLEQFVSIALHAATPLLFGGVIAYIVNILMSFYEHKLPTSGKPYSAKLRRPLCMVLAFITLILVICAPHICGWMKTSTSEHTSPTKASFTHWKI